MDQYVDDNRRKVARALARALLHGASEPDELQQRATTALGKKWPWFSRLIRELLFEIGPQLQPAHHDEIVKYILSFRPFLNAFHAAAPAPRVRGYFTFHPAMSTPPRALTSVSLPALDTPGDLAKWLDIAPEELDWFADINGWGSSTGTEKLHHYHYWWRQKASGGMRLIEAPKSRLRAIQRKILHEILDRVPVHNAAHGCVPGRSVFGNAAMHSGQATVLRLDLTEFFPGIRASRVHALFRTLGYPMETARYLTGLTTHCISFAVVRSVPADAEVSTATRRERMTWAKRYLERHLPQGAPTSPALANLCAYRLDLRLDGAAQETGGRYSRYVDDLVFSFNTASRARCLRIALMAYGIILEEGFSPNIRKTRVMPRGRAQHVTGLVVNDKPNLPRREYDLLKAILTNCTRYGPASQNREARPDFRAHLLGRLSYLRQINPARASKLQALFEKIQWA